MAENKDFYSTSELARLLGVTRVAVFQKIKAGEVNAKKVGRNYIIPKSEAEAALGRFLLPERRQEIERNVKDTVLKYGEALKKLGKE